MGVFNVTTDVYKEVPQWGCSTIKMCIQIYLVSNVFDQNVKRYYIVLNMLSVLNVMFLTLAGTAGWSS